LREIPTNLVIPTPQLMHAITGVPPCLLPPGGYLFIVFGLPALLVLGPMSECGGGSVNGGPYTQTCTGVMALPVWQQYLIGAAEITAFLVLLMSPILVAIYMTWRLRRWAAEPQG
jgi:hypothetical protein